MLRLYTVSTSHALLLSTFLTFALPQSAFPTPGFPSTPFSIPNLEISLNWWKDLNW